VADTVFVEYPPPMPSIFQTCFGPASSQACSKPVSLDFPVLPSPRHSGQSPDHAVDVNANITPTHIPTTALRITTSRISFF